MLALPIFTASHPATIVGANELNFCVRDGNRWTLVAINTNYILGRNRKQHIKERRKMVTRGRVELPFAA